MDDAIIVVTLWSDREKFDSWVSPTMVPSVYAIRKFNPKAKYTNVILSLTKQIRSRYDQWKYLVPSEFDEIFTINVYKFTKNGWPMEVGELRDYIR